MKLAKIFQYIYLFNLVIRAGKSIMRFSDYHENLFTLCGVHQKIQIVIKLEINLY